MYGFEGLEAFLIIFRIKTVVSDKQNNTISTQNNTKSSYRQSVLQPNFSWNQLPDNQFLNSWWCKSLPLRDWIHRDDYAAPEGLAVPAEVDGGADARLQGGGVRGDEEEGVVNAHAAPAIVVACQQN